MMLVGSRLDDRRELIIQFLVDFKTPDKNWYAESIASLQSFEFVDNFQPQIF